MTQIARYAHFLKVPIRTVRGQLRLNLTVTGSVLVQTIDAGADSVDAEYEIESDADPEQIKAVLRNARNGCWAAQMVAKPIPVNDTFVVNGQSFAF